VFGEAGNQVVLEELLSGPEVSFLGFCDGTHAHLYRLCLTHVRHRRPTNTLFCCLGTTVVPMPAAQDHKRALDNVHPRHASWLSFMCVY
jgi:phosphoribosylamine-glycine ligase